MPELPTSEFLLSCIELAEKTFQSNPTDSDHVCLEVRDETSNDVIERALVGRQQPDNRFFCALRGTQVTTNWLRNLDTTLVSVGENGEMAHRGFKEANDDLVAIGLKQILAGAPRDDLLLIGYSKGGAQATLLAWDLLRAGRSNIQLVTFGSPRVGNVAFAQALTRYEESGILRHTRCVHSMDPVVAVPIRGGEYKHCTRPYRVDTAPAAAAADLLAAAVKATEDNETRVHERLAHCHSLAVYAQNIRHTFLGGLDRTQEALIHVGSLTNLFISRFLSRPPTQGGEASSTPPNNAADSSSST